VWFNIINYTNAHKELKEIIIKLFFIFIIFSFYIKLCYTIGIKLTKQHQTKNVKKYQILLIL
jgi:hypothetical protein